MGMTIGNGKGSMADPNIVPLIDILLVLIIIFMVITPATPQGHKAQVPQPSESTAEPPFAQAIVVQVLGDSALKINDEPHTWETLGPRLAEIFKRRAEKVAFVRGEEQVLFQEVARAIDIMRANGVERVGLITAKIGVNE